MLYQLASSSSLLLLLVTLLNILASPAVAQNQNVTLGYCYASRDCQPAPDLPSIQITASANQNQVDISSTKYCASFLPEPAPRQGMDACVSKLCGTCTHMDREVCAPAPGNGDRWRCIQPHGHAMGKGQGEEGEGKAM